MKRLLRAILSIGVFSGGAAAAAPRVIKHVTVYSQAGRYGGWPANHGIWSWGNEIVVGFERGYFKYNGTRHSIDWDRPAEHVLARSLDGGMTWTLEKPKDLIPRTAPRWRACSPKEAANSRWTVPAASIS